MKLSLLSIIILLASSPSINTPSQPPVRPFDADRAFADLQRQCDFGYRIPGTPAHRECGQWLAQQLAASADKVQLQQFTVNLDGVNLPLTNIIATFQPVNKSANNDKHVLLCAHWDTRPIANHDPDPAKRNLPILGANDGASGVAVLLEIARALKAHPPNALITIVLFDGEDYGPGIENMFLGSRRFAATYDGPPVSWAVLLDMVGDRDLRIPYEAYSLRHAPDVVERIWRAAERAGATAFVRERGPAVLDDHVFLLNKGIPCINVIDFDYPYWHTTADTPDKCSPDSLAQVGRTLLTALADDNI